MISSTATSMIKRVALSLEEIGKLIDDSTADESKKADLKIELQYNPIPCVDFWIRLCENIGNAASSVQNSLDIYKTAVLCCPDFRLIDKMVEFALLKHEDDELETAACRDCLSNAIQVCGHDLLFGGVIYDKYREFEVETYEDLLDCEAAEQDLLAAKNRIIKLVHSQMATPLANNEESLQAISKLLGEMFTEADTSLIRPEILSKNFSQSLEKRKMRVVYETHLLSDAYKESSIEKQYENWKAYIDFEIKEKEQSRAERLYQRALLAIPSHPMIWYDAVLFTAFSLSNLSTALGIVEKALRLYPNHSLFNKIYLICLESCGADITVVESAVSRALYSGLQSIEEYFDIQLFPCDYLFRRIRKQKDDKSAEFLELTTQLKQHFAQITESLLAYYPDWSAAHLRICKYEIFSNQYINSFAEFQQKFNASKLADKIAKNENWESLIKFQNKNYLFWTEYARWATAQNNDSLARNVYRRATACVDFKLEMCKEWYQFECIFGSFSDILHVTEKLHKLETELAARTSAEQKVTATPGASAAEDFSATSKVSSKRKIDTEENVETMPRSKTLRVVESSEGRSQGSNASNAVKAPPKALIVLSNLLFTLSEEDIACEVMNILKADSTHATDIENSIVVKLILSKAGKSRGVANIELKEDLSQSDAESLIHFISQKLSGSSIRDRAVTVEVVEKAQDVDDSDKHAHHPTAVFVSKLPLSFVDSDLHELFRKCGDIAAAKVSRDKKTNESKGHGLVQFRTEHGKYAALKLNRTAVHGKLISVLPSKFGVLGNETSSITIEATKVDTDTMAVESVVAVDDPKKKPSALALRPRQIKQG